MITDDLRLRVGPAKDLPAYRDGLHLPLRLRNEQDLKPCEILRPANYPVRSLIRADKSLHVRLVHPPNSAGSSTTR